jgi:hypothetical protein
VAATSSAAMAMILQNGRIEDSQRIRGDACSIAPDRCRFKMANG